MGQSAVAIFWGVEPPTGVNFHGEGYGPDDPKGLLAIMRRTFKDEDVPESPYEAEPPLLGFYVAIGGGGREGAGDLTGCPVDTIEEIYADHMASARKRWDQFALWASGHGVALPPAQLWLTWAETA